MNQMLRSNGARVIGAALILQTIWLGVLGVPIPFQLGILLIAGLTAAVGWIVVRRFLSAIEDGPARAAFGLLAGMAVLTGVASVFFHRAIGDPLGLTRTSAAWMAVAVTSIVGVILWRRDRGSIVVAPAPESSARVWMALVGAALLMSACTLHGIGNGPGTTVGRMLPKGERVVEDLAPNWGKPGDVPAHLVRVPIQVVDDGLPDRNVVTQRGTQVWVLTVSLPVGGEFHNLDPLRAAKVLDIGAWFALLAIGRWVLLGLFGLSNRVATVGTAALALFGPVNTPPWNVAVGAYRGFVHATATMYLNVPQVYTVAFGLAAVALIGAAIAKPSARVGLPVGVAFLVVSAWFKPSGLFVLGPALVGLLVWFWKRDRAMTLVSATLLAVPALAWMVYPTAIDADRLQLGVVFDPMGGYERLAAERFAEFFVSSDLILALTILMLSFAAWIIPGVALVGRALRSRVREAKGSPVYGGPVAITILLMGSLVLGLVVAFLFTEVEDAGNMKWPVIFAYVVALPVLFRLVTEVRSMWWRRVAWAVVALQMWGGALQLARSVMFSSL